jgi:hypothetical protein
MTDIVLNQCYPGGVMKQLADAAGDVVYDQYAPGGCVGQLYTASGLDDPLDQYASGGPIHQIEIELEGGGGGGSSGYTAQAVALDGDTYLSRGATLTGVTTFDTLLISIWTKVAAGDAYFLLGSMENGVIDFNVQAGHITMNTYDADFNGDRLSDLDGYATAEWTHFLIAYDRTDTNKCKLFINGVDNTEVDYLSNTTAPTLVGETDFFVGWNGSGVDKEFTGDVADIYIAFGQWLDLTNPANVAKFIADGVPVDLGANGSTPTGTAPTIFFKGPAASFATNLGTGGPFTLTGALTDAATSPSSPSR